MPDDAATMGDNLVYFDRPSGDVILRSSDGFHHRVHRVILSEASPFFSTMFSLPQTEMAGVEQLPSDADESSIPVIPVTEGSLTLSHLLGLCYPAPPPPPSSLTLDEVERVLDASSKYEIEVARAFCLSILEIRIKEQPITAYGLARGAGTMPAPRARAPSTLEERSVRRGA